MSAFYFLTCPWWLKKEKPAASCRGRIKRQSMATAKKVSPQRGSLQDDDSPQGHKIRWH